MIEALFLLVPAAVSLVYGESEWVGFVVAAVAAAVSGGVAELATSRENAVIRSREGFIITSLVWIIFALFGIIPFMMARAPLGFTDAVFEVISGFTTTGASVITDLEGQSRGILFWRAFTQWIGGLGIILFMLAVLPELDKSSGLSMFHAEATGITHDKLHPRIRRTAISVWCVYIVLTISSTLFLWAGPMDFFDSICHAFAAIATGGFATHDAGLAYWHSNYVLVVILVTMFLAGLNFIMIYNAAKKGVRVMMSNSVFRTFGCICLGAFLLFLVNNAVRGGRWDLDHIFIYPMFHVVSAITSTGFSISEAEQWGPFSLFLTLMLMYCGACAGSTTGGLKVDRIMVMGANLRNELRKVVFPKRMYVVQLNGSALNNSLLTRIAAFVSLYFIITAVCTGIVAMFGYSFADSLFMVSSCIGCNGLGYGVTGAGGSFASLPDVVKWLFTLLMLIGRLELFTVIVLFLPSFWKK